MCVHLKDAGSKSIFDFVVKDAEGNDVSLETFRGAHVGWCSLLL
jgi:hypothetical protein